MYARVRVWSFRAYLRASNGDTRDDAEEKTRILAGEIRRFRYAEKENRKRRADRTEDNLIDHPSLIDDVRPARRKISRETAIRQ